MQCGGEADALDAPYTPYGRKEAWITEGPGRLLRVLLRRVSAADDLCSADLKPSVGV
jgi:hypothetical protein